MGGVSLYDYQKDAINRMKNGCILNGGVGSGKSRTSLAYYYKTQGGDATREEAMMTNPCDLYIITTARKRDTNEWLGELIPFELSPFPDCTPYKHKVVIDSWNNIQKYKDVEDAFFIFDEDRVTGSGAWVKSFKNIAKHNRWIILSATPGDTWLDYFAVFQANGFFKTKREFEDNHVIYDHRVKFPKVSAYRNEGRLIRMRNSILIDMDFHRDTVRHDQDVYCGYDRIIYKDMWANRRAPGAEEPFKSASEMCYAMRKLVNSDVSRQEALVELTKKNKKVIIFYNFDYELEILRNQLYTYGTEIAEWNGHKHEPMPTSDRWIYLVQYTSGCEGWNCITTDTIIFYSQNYSFKVMEQAKGRIDRLNTPYTHLYYYHLKSRAPIDLAISRALRNKEQFNERGFINKR